MDSLCEPDMPSSSCSYGRRSTITPSCKHFEEHGLQKTIQGKQHSVHELVNFSRLDRLCAGTKRHCHTEVWICGWAALMGPEVTERTMWNLLGTQPRIYGQRTRCHTHHRCATLRTGSDLRIEFSQSLTFLMHTCTVFEKRSKYTSDCRRIS